MADEIEVTVKLRWLGRGLYASNFQVGFVAEDNMKRVWHAVIVNRPGSAAKHATEAEAKRAVEAAAIKALKGDADE